MKQEKQRRKPGNNFFALRIFILVMVFTAGISAGNKKTRAESTVDVPEGIQLTDDNSSVVLSWNESEDDVYFEIQICRDSDFENPAFDITTEETSVTKYYKDFGQECVSDDSSYLYMGEKYYFRVRAVKETEDTLIYSDWSVVYNKTLSYDAPTVTGVESSGAKSVTISWSSSSDMSGYRIYRSTEKNGTYTRVKTITDVTDGTMTYTDKKVETGVKYYYKVCTYNSYFSYTNGTYSEIKSVTPKPAVPTLKAKSSGYNSIKLTWGKAETGVDGYAIYRSTSKNGTYKRIKTIKSRTTVSYTNKKLTTGKKYYYKIKAYTKNNGKTYWSSASSAVSAKPTVSVPTIKSIKFASATSVTIKWSKVSGASGYIIYRATSKNGTYKKIATVKSGKTLSYTAKKLKNGKKYYFKVKAYRTVKGKRYAGSASAVKAKMMNKLGYEGESYESRCKRIWGSYEYEDYASASAASKGMKTISVKVWDINSSGKKYTKTLYVTVHKKIASTVKAIFKEIYNGSEKFPIHDIGGYSWRGSSSSSEHCEGLAIDINANENAMMYTDTGEILAGSFWKPGKNAYSIPEDGDVVKAFEKYASIGEAMAGEIKQIICISHISERDKLKIRNAINKTTERDKLKPEP